MLQSEQIPLDLTCRPATGREDFMIAPCNEQAMAWLDRWPNWPAPVVLLQGPASCGKSHMADVWASKNGAIRVSGQDLLTKDAAQIFAGAHFDHGKSSSFLIDHIDPWIGSADIDTTLFHLYNMLKEHGKTALITARMLPQQIDFAVPDLASRLRAAPLVQIKAPDETLLSAILVKLFRDRQLQIDEGVVKYIIPRVDRSFAAIHNLVDRADAMALAKKRPISVPLMREVMAQDMING